MNATYKWYLGIILTGTIFNCFAGLGTFRFSPEYIDRLVGQVTNPTASEEKEEEEQLESTLPEEIPSSTQEQPSSENPPTTASPVQEGPVKTLALSIIEKAESLDQIEGLNDLANTIGQIVKYQTSMIAVAISESFLSSDNFELIKKTPLFIIKSLNMIINRLSNTTRKELLQLLVEAEKLIKKMITNGSWQYALQSSQLAQKITDLLSSDEENRLEIAQQIIQKIKQLLEQSTEPIPSGGPGGPSVPTPPTPPAPPTKGPSVPTPPITPSAPTSPAQPTAPRPVPGKAQESINKANSKLSSALRRLDAIKGYYKEIDPAERKVIKAKAEKVFKDYSGGISSFVQRIQQVKNEAGNQLDPNKLAPFNTFIELANRLNNGIKGL